MHDQGTSADLSGTVLDGRYQLLELIGQGASGSVYKGRQLNLDRPVAVKFLKDDLAACPERLARFQQEARLASQLHHENLVSTFAFGIFEGGRPYLILQYIDGCTLASVLEQEGKLPAGQTVRIFLQLCLALAEVHAHQVVHRDITPANIFLEKHGEGYKAYLADFGIAKALEGTEFAQADLTSAGVIVGTPKYMSPEQCTRRALDGRSDIYSLAAVMYRCLFGHAPFEGGTDLVLMHKHVHEPAAISKEERKLAGGQLAALTLRCLEKDADRRVQSARALHDLLQAVPLPDVSPVAGGSLVKKLAVVSLVVLPAALALAWTAGIQVQRSTPAIDLKRINMRQTPAPTGKREAKQARAGSSSTRRSVFLDKFDDEANEIHRALMSDSPCSIKRVRTMESLVEAKLARANSFDEIHSMKSLLIRLKLLESGTLLKAHDREAARKVLSETDRYIGDVREEAPWLEVKRQFQLAQLAGNEKQMAEAFDRYLKMGLETSFRSPADRFEGCDFVVDFALSHGYYGLGLKYAKLAANVYPDPDSEDYDPAQMVRVICQSMLLHRKLGMSSALAADQQALDVHLSRLKKLVAASEKIDESADSQQKTGLTQEPSAAGEKLIRHFTRLRKHVDIADQCAGLARKALLLDEPELASVFENYGINVASLCDQAYKDHAQIVRGAIQRIAHNYLHAGRPEAAITLLEKHWGKKELSGDCSTIPAFDLDWMSECYLTGGNASLAEHLLRAALDRGNLRSSEVVHLKTLLGLTLFKEGKADEAKDLLEASLAEPPDTLNARLSDFDGLVALSEYYLERGNLERAKLFGARVSEWAFEEFITIRWMSIKAHQLRGKIALSEGRFAEAKAELLTALSQYEKAAPEDRRKASRESLQQDLAKAKNPGHRASS
jgi:serine/threonine protein kinase/tetratricopeptide (TPR) repeat protein